MVEIARIFAEGFKENGLEAEVVFNEVPAKNIIPEFVQIIVAPHEFYPLFLAQNCEPEELEAVSRASFLLNVEQPGSTYFELAYEQAKRALGVLDINEQGVAEFSRRGIEACLALLGYTPYLESGTKSSQEQARPIDVLFLGHVSPKREIFLSNHADFFNRYNCHLILARTEKLRLKTTPGFFVEQERNQLLKSSKILLNLHSTDRSYFEWHRAITAIANGCMVVSEESQYTDPLLNGEHFEMASLEKLIPLVEHYLEKPAERLRVSNEAYKLITTKLTAREICLNILDFLTEKRPSTSTVNPAPPAIPPQTTGFTRATTIILEPLNKELSSKDKLAGLVNRLLRRNTPTTVIEVVPDMVVSDQIAIAQPSELQKLQFEIINFKTELAERDAVTSRREAVIRRIELAQQCELLGMPPWQVLTNKIYAEKNNQPAVTVIITLYNYAQHIIQCLQSVAETHVTELPGGLEIVVIDDASTDTSAKLVEKFMGETELPVRLVRKTFNTGLADARNIGLKLADAPYVFTLDADNWIYPNCLEVLYKEIVRTGSASVYGIVNRFDEDSAGIGLMSYYAWDVKNLVEAPYIDAMAMFDKQKLASVGGYSTELVQYGWFGWEDYDLFLKLAQAGYKVTLLPRILTAYRAHDTSMLNTTNRYIEVMAKYFTGKFGDLVQLYRDDTTIMLFGVSIKNEPAQINSLGLAPVYEGHIDVMTLNMVQGWAWDRHKPNAPVKLDIYHDNKLLKTIVANGYRFDLKGAGIGDGFHAFQFVASDVTYVSSGNLQVKYSGTDIVLT